VCVQILGRHDFPRAAFCVHRRRVRGWRLRIADLRHFFLGVQILGRHDFPMAAHCVHRRRVRGWRLHIADLRHFFFGCADSRQARLSDGGELCAQKACAWLETRAQDVNETVKILKSQLISHFT